MEPDTKSRRRRWRRLQRAAREFEDGADTVQGASEPSPVACPRMAEVVGTSELVIAILLQLDSADDLLRAGACCNMWRCMSESPCLQLWRRLSCRRWSDLRQGLESVIDWKSFFRRRITLEMAPELLPMRCADGRHFMVQLTERTGQTSRAIISRSFDGHAALPSCLGSNVGFCWPSELQSPLANWPEGSHASNWHISVTAFRASDQCLCELLHAVPMMREQVERVTSSDEQIIDAIVSHRLPVLTHVFDRPGFEGSTLRIKARLTPLVHGVGDAASLRWHFELLFLFGSLLEEGDEEGCALDQDSSLAILDGMRWI